MRISALGITLGLGLALTVGCGDDGTGGSGGTGGTGAGGQAGGTNTGATGGGGAGGQGPTCEPPEGTAAPKNEILVDQVIGAARDETGAAITNFDLQLCGANGCLYASTNAIGQATFNNNLSTDMIDRPLFKPGDSLVLGKIGYLYDETKPSPLPGIFPRMIDSQAQMVPGESATAGDVTLDVGADTIVVVDDLIYDEPAKQTFRAATVPVDLVDDVTGDPDFVMVASLGPEDTIFCPGATVSIDNYAGLTAGAAVEFWGQTLTVGEEFGPYGGWVKLADGAVSADGSTVSTTGTGLPVLVTVAIKLK
ncbi:MAG: hypothetical protein U0271_39485 [Polyangiaceae bacterium]